MAGKKGGDRAVAVKARLSSQAFLGRLFVYSRLIKIPSPLP